jgi:predicted nucleotidyltransferase component of viral defense system
MITRDRLRVLARSLGVRLDYAEKNYVNSWLLWGLFTHSYGENLLFKGGTALSKLYFPQSWRFSEDLDFSVDGAFHGSEAELREALDAITEHSGITFTIREHYEAQQAHYPTHYVDISIRYEAILEGANTTSLDVMVDEHVAFDPVMHTHKYEGVPEFELSAYSVEEIFAEKLRALYQRGIARDYYDLYQLIRTDTVSVNAGIIRPAFEAKCDHDDLAVDLHDGLPSDRQNDVQNQWETVLPDLTTNPPPFDDAWTTIEDYIEQFLVSEVD